MVQESISKKTIAIIGAGPAGCICAAFLLKHGIKSTIFDKGKYLRTILPTGGGRCNLANEEFDFRLLAKNYPRGEKFLYSVFSKFATQETIDFFNSIGIKTYTQEDKRIFPISNSSKDVQDKLLKQISNCSFINKTIKNIEKLDNCYKIVTNKSSYAFDIVIIAIGGHSDFSILNKLNINIEPPTQALVGLVTKEKFSDIAGVSLKNVTCKLNKNLISGDLLFTHKGVSGPLIYKISSLKARENLPYNLNLQLIQEFDLQKELNENPHKEIKNLLSTHIPKSLSIHILNKLNIKEDTQCHLINGKTRDLILNTLTNLTITVIDKVPDSEVVTCGGISLKEINPKTLESKKYKDLYFCGEVLDIDGFCGGFNLQNCWSTGFIVAQSIVKDIT